MIVVLLWMVFRPTRRSRPTGLYKPCPLLEWNGKLWLCFSWCECNCCSDDSLGYEYPFSLKAVQKDGCTCTWCPWYRYDHCTTSFVVVIIFKPYRKSGRLIWKIVNAKVRRGSTTGQGQGWEVWVDLSCLLQELPQFIYWADRQHKNEVDSFRACTQTWASGARESSVTHWYADPSLQSKGEQCNSQVNHDWWCCGREPRRDHE